MIEFSSSFYSIFEHYYEFFMFFEVYLHSDEKKFVLPERSEILFMHAFGVKTALLLLHTALAHGRRQGKQQD